MDHNLVTKPHQMQFFFHRNLLFWTKIRENVGSLIQLKLPGTDNNHSVFSHSSCILTDRPLWTEPIRNFEITSRYDSSGVGSALYKATTCTGQHKHRVNVHRHPCLEYDSNPRFQCLTGRRNLMPRVARPQWTACFAFYVRTDDISLKFLYNFP